MMYLEHEAVANYANRRSLLPREAEMLDNLEFRGQHPFSTEAEVHAFYECLRMMVAPEELGEVPQSAPEYGVAGQGE